MVWTIRRKLMALATAGSLVAVLLGGASLWSVAIMARIQAQIVTTQEATRNHLESDMMHDALRGDVLGSLIATTPAEQQTALDDLRDHADNFREHVALNEALDLEREVKAALVDAGPALAAYIAKAEELVALAAADRAAAMARMPDFYTAFEVLEGRMSALSDLIGASAASRVAEAAQASRRSRWIAIVFASGAAIGLAALAILLTLSIVRPLDRVVECLRRVAVGDLTVPSLDVGEDEVGRMAAALHETIDHLRMSISGINDNASHLAAAGDSLHGVSDGMASMAKETVKLTRAASEESGRVSDHATSGASACEQMSHGIKDIAASAQAAADVARAAVGATGKATEATAKLNQSGREIESAVQLIANIASKTGDLAGTAVKEAVRASEAGKGFAVVAEEVKELAKETANATDDISTRIKATLKSSRAALEAVRTMSLIANEAERHTADLAEVLAERVPLRLAADGVGSGFRKGGDGDDLHSLSVRAREAVEVNRRAVRAAQDIERLVTTLSEGGAAIGEVNRVITSIAAQTNLLALNATIEAGRADSAARGIGEIAEQVEELAGNTTNVTEEIQRKVVAILRDSGAAESAVADIVAVVGKMDQHAASIAAAVQQQAAAAAEITRSVSGAARGATQIASSLAGVERAAQGTSEGAAKTLGAAEEVQGKATELRTLVNRFQCG